jgi:hypothetical protein
MTPQALLRARFSELAESLRLQLSVRRQTGKFYFTVTGEWKNTQQFMRRTFPEAWMTSAAGPECTYGLPLPQVERILSELEVAPAWLQVPSRIAQAIRAERAFERLPILADALVEAGCTNELILSHCRESAPHQETCWVVELLLGPERRRRRALES